MDVLIESSKLDDLYLEIHVEKTLNIRVSRASDQFYNAKLLKFQNSQSRLVFWDDPSGRPALTNKQSKKLSEWIRISQLSTNPVLILNKISYERIQQGYVGNCSLLSSFASMANYDSTYNNEIISKIFIPEHSNNIIGYTRQPIQSTRFSCRVYINGTARIIRVDDWVPIRDDGRLLCAHSTSIEELWITILEKVFIKLLGNTYDLIGTNPCIDLYRFTNFIPEIIKIQDCKDDFIWKNLFQRFKNGLCMSCLGTLGFDNVQVSDEHELITKVNGVSPISGIVSNHAYSVIDLREVDGYRLAFLKNPWGKISWKKKFSDFDTSDLAKSVFKAIDYQPKSTDNGTFWIEWSDVIKWFSYLYISHNPSQFKYERIIHLRWNSFPHFNGSLLNNYYHMGFNPQLLVSFLDSIDSMWILLIQHRKSSKDELRYIATHLFFREVKIKLFNNPDIQGTYYNAECALNKFDNLPGKFHLTTTLLDESPTEPFNITIRAFSNEDFTLDSVISPVDDNAEFISITSKWDDFCGGVNDIEKYFLNPKIKFTVNQDSKVLLILESKEPFHINLKVFNGIDELDLLLKNKRLITSGLCRLHICSVEDEFPCGVYTIIPSTYNGGIGTFRVIGYIKSLDSDDIDNLGEFELIN